jgi:homoserine kinase
MQIKVPATISDFGPGSASIGIALQQFLTIEVLEERETWLVEHNFGYQVAGDDTNYIVAVARKLAPNMVAHHLKITSDIAPGLGLQTAMLLAGITVAEVVGGVELDDYTKLTLAARTEGQPAAVVAGLLGGVTVSYFDQDDLYASGVVTPNYTAVVYTPAVAFLETVHDSMTGEVVAKQAAAGNMLVAAWQNEQADLAGRLLEVDFTRTFVSLELTSLRQATHALDVYATFPVAHGAAIVTLVETDRVSDLLDVLRYVEQLTGTFEVIPVSGRGVQVDL